MKFRVAIQMPDESFDVDVSGIYLTPKSNRKEFKDKSTKTLMMSIYTVIPE